MEVNNFTALVLKPRESTSVPNEFDDEWTPQPVWTLLKKKSLIPAGIQTRTIQSTRFSHIISYS